MKTNKTSDIIIISEEQVKKLARVHDPHCVSIFIPVGRAGKDIDDKHPQLRLKNILKSVRNELHEFGLSEKEVQEYLQPLSTLLDEVHFWRNQSDGLAFFLSKKGFEYYSLPIDFKEYYYIDEHFYLRLVLPMLFNDGRFFILSFNIEQIKLYEASKYTISEIRIDDLVPQRPEDVVGYDYEQKNLQSRPDKSGQMKNATHGHGAGKDDKDAEIKVFMQAVNDGLMKILNDQQIPLILVTEGQYKGEFENIFDYNFLKNDYVGLNPKNIDVFTLHELAWEKMKAYFYKNLDEKKSAFKDKMATGYTSEDIYDILPASLDGQVEALFIRNDFEQFGIYDHANRALRVDNEHSFNNSSLINLAAVHVFLNGGAVYQLEADEMPVPANELSALYRFVNPTSAFKIK
ncbi:MAG: hypothetical protein K9H84_03785 [Bacteroidales bacterium]|nr:hypothetical protein [Bacteroidales bacterium]